MYDLRSETDNQKLVDEIAEDWTTSSISPIQMAMCEFAKKLTENPSKVNKKDIELIAIGIGHDVSRYYSKAVTIMDVDQLGEVLLNELSEIFQIN